MSTEELYQNGFIVKAPFLTAEETDALRTAVYHLLTKKDDTRDHRSDLAPSYRKKSKEIENVTQIMWPTLYIDGLSSSAAFVKSTEVAQQLLGEDMRHDFNMIFFKAPNSASPTPPHQDMAYWPDLTDKRALSFWIALDDSDISNGCMWFVTGPESREPLKHYTWDAAARTLACEANEDMAVAVPLKAGSCSAHLGDTVHYSRGNTTNTPRAALIINYRPKLMIDAERKAGFDHGASNNVRVNRNSLTK